MLNAVDPNLPNGIFYLIMWRKVITKDIVQDSQVPFEKVFFYSTSAGTYTNTSLSQ